MTGGNAQNLCVSIVTISLVLSEEHHPQGQSPLVSAEQLKLVTTASWRASKRRPPVVAPAPSIASDDHCDGGAFASTSSCSSLLGYHGLSHTVSSNNASELGRSLERLFEEAAATGVLSAAARKLKEFPTQLSVRYDLSDLIAADLSLNQLTELPGCMCDLDSLETLQLRSNCIQRLPTSLQLLKSLAFLDLSGNQLHSLPQTLFFLRLQVLLLAGNRITTIPREIRQLENCLHELDLSYNRLVELPSDIAFLKSLRVLNLSHNRLIDLPGDIGFMQLRVLNISHNCLTALPFELCNLGGLAVDFQAHGNPLVAPPVDVVGRGREHIFKWLKSQSGADYGDWAFSRCSNINATLRRPERIPIERCSSKQSDTSTLTRKTDRRTRQTRFNNVGGGSDSGYTSTGDDHRHSHELGVSKLSLEEINERGDVSISTPSSERSCSEEEVSAGDLAKEVMLAYAETVVEKKMSARGVKVATSPVVSPTVMDLSNNNLPADSCTLTTSAVPPKPPTSSPPASPPSSELVTSTESESSADPEPVATPVKQPPPAVPTKTIRPTQARIPPPSTTLKSKVKSTTVTSSLPVTKKASPPSTRLTSVQRSIVPPTTKTAPSGIKKPSLSTSKIAPAPSTSNLTAPRRSDPIRSRMAASTYSLAKAKSIDDKTPPPTAIRKPAPTTGMSKSVSSGSGLVKKTTTTIAAPSNGTGTSVVDSMRKIIESKLPGVKLPTENERLAKELSSGIHLCTFTNKIKVKSVPTVYNSLPGEASISPLKAKRNADGFVAACKRLGVPEVIFSEHVAAVGLCMLLIGSIVLLLEYPI
uniref:Calponin-homology (CH) domain-containing protein n=1 Tax=Panagrellus redivivus TaxID=6233 RepID=A0A7E4W751_PANRE